MTQYLTFEEREQLRKEVYEHRVFMAQMEARLKIAKKEGRLLRWQIRKQKLCNFLGIA